MKLFYELASLYAKKTSFRYKQTASVLFKILNYRLYENLFCNKLITAKQSGDTMLYKKYSFHNELSPIVRTNDSLTVDLARSCQNNYFDYCFRYDVFITPFTIYKSFLDSALIKRLRYNIQNHKLSAYEIRVASEWVLKYYYYPDDTILCNKMPYICEYTNELKRSSLLEKESLDSIANKLNRWRLNMRINSLKEIDLRLSVFKSLEVQPIMELATEVETYGRDYKNIDWQFVLARLKFKDYRTKYIDSIDSLKLKYDNITNNNYKWLDYMTLYQNVILLKSRKGINKLVSCLLKKEIFSNGIYNQNFGLSFFLMLRKNIPELNEYGRSIFVQHCNKVYIGKKVYYDMATVANKTDSEKGFVSCDYIYEALNSDEYIYMPSNFYFKMYQWMVKNKDKYTIDYDVVL